MDAEKNVLMDLLMELYNDQTKQIYEYEYIKIEENWNRGKDRES